MPGDAPTAGPGRRALVGRLASALAAVALLGAGCGDDGRELRPPSPDQTTSTTVPAPSTTALPDQMVLSSPAIPQGGEIGIDHTFRGLDVSPPLTWTPPPETTVELAVVVHTANNLPLFLASPLSPSSLQQGAVDPWSLAVSLPLTLGVTAGLTVWVSRTHGIRLLEPVRGVGRVAALR